MPTFTHARDLIELAPGAVVDGAEEIVRTTSQTGRPRALSAISTAPR